VQFLNLARQAANPALPRPRGYLEGEKNVATVVAEERGHSL